MSKHFTRFEVHPVRDIGEDAEVTTEAKAQYYTLYGFLEGEGDNGIYVAIGDYTNRADAELMADYIRAV